MSEKIQKKKEEHKIEKRPKNGDQKGKNPHRHGCTVAGFRPKTQFSGLFPRFEMIRPCEFFKI